MEGLRTVDKLDDTELRRAYVVACNSYDSASKAKREIEKEMKRRFEKELEENRRIGGKGMNIFEKLLAIQQELKAPKGQYNSFGKYKYRSCEDILEAVKPICAKYNALLTVSDELVHMGDRYYIKATATLINAESTSIKIYKHEYDEITQSPIEEAIRNTAFAREEETKKGMDGSQITGTASSYARKYALNGLFCIDDTKDADTDEFKKQEDKPETKTDKNLSDTILDLVNKYAEMKQGDPDELLKFYLTKYKAKSIGNLSYKDGVEISKTLSAAIERSVNND